MITTLEPKGTILYFTSRNPNYSKCEGAIGIVMDKTWIKCLYCPDDCWMIEGRRYKIHNSLPWRTEEQLIFTPEERP